MRKISGLILFIVLSAGAVSQPLYTVPSQYMVNGLAINPAFAGSREVFAASVMHRRQWAGLPDGPIAQTFSAHTPLKNEKVALGLYLLNEVRAIEKSFQVYGNYAFRFRLGKGKLSLGLKGGVEINSYNLDELILDDPTDQIFYGAADKLTQPNFGTGFYYYSPKFFIGGSIPLLMIYEQDTLTYKEEATYGLNMYNYLLTAGFLVGNSPNFKWKPSFLVKFLPGTPVQFDINNSFLLFSDRLWLGASFRTNDSFEPLAITGLVEIKLKEQWMFGYSYDYSLAGYTGSALRDSHELYIRYEFNYRLNATDIR